MASEPKQDLLKSIPPITALLKNPAVAGWLNTHPLPLVTDCLRDAVAGKMTTGQLALAQRLSYEWTLQRGF